MTTDQMRRARRSNGLVLRAPTRPKTHSVPSLLECWSVQTTQALGKLVVTMLTKPGSEWEDSARLILVVDLRAKLSCRVCGGEQRQWAEMVLYVLHPSPGGQWRTNRRPLYMRCQVKAQDQWYNLIHSTDVHGIRT